MEGKAYLKRFLQIFYSVNPRGRTLAVFLPLVFYSPTAIALGYLSLSNSTFLKNAKDQSELSTTIGVGIDLEKEGSLLNGSLHLMGFMFADDPSSLSVETTDTYISTSSQIWKDHEISLGRRRYDWSLIDQHWQMGLYSPRFTWDPIKPFDAGLTGFFYSYKNSSFQLTAFASPIDIPERSYPLYAIAGDIVSPSRYWNALPEQIQILNNVNADILYSIRYPSLAKMILRPGAAIKARMGGNEGYWTSLSYGFLSVHQPDIAVDASLDADAFEVNADLYPRFRQHHLLSWEGGYLGDDWMIWSSLTRELPLQMSTPDSYISNPVGPSVVGSLGAELRWRNGFSAYSSFLIIQESPNQVTSGSSESGVSVPLPDRYRLRRAVQAGGSWGGSPVHYGLKWVYDYQYQNALVTLDATYPSESRRKPNQRWTVQAGFDVVFAKNIEGYIGQMSGNDRVRVGVGYDF
jgi:hypothetical protein